jgi:DNA-binding NarL/FixJ family response regulator
VIGEASDGWKAVELVKQLKPDVVLLDLFMPGIDGIETIQRLIAVQPRLGIIVLTAYAKEDKAVEVIKAGALGYVVKDAQPEELVQSIRFVSAGTPAISPTLAWKLLHAGKDGDDKTSRRSMELSDREAEVLRLLTKGKTDQEIASQLVLSDVTIRTHVSRILTKLGLQNRVQAALYGVRSGMVSLEETYDMNEAYS